MGYEEGLGSSWRLSHKGQPTQLHKCFCAQGTYRVEKIQDIL